MSSRARPAVAVERVTFREMVEDLRVPLAVILWQRAVAFSKLRHLAIEKHRGRTARRCGEYKARLIGRVCHLAPELVRVVPASDSEQLWSVRFRQRGCLHLPPRLVGLV